ncbi:uncharacterized protein LOC126745271 isoform X2 [Anthonomus grandis grandis]|uniref:uncharacterized protein LOC126745271 isoform X2 n=1 Tax=Anthonomus grandis grandis TaxID=2921223 RepID=UPI00216585CC|nr:uncharacterized protein LOC126745271 isoform X2 [Anthonomus grandis grandis]
MNVYEMSESLEAFMKSVLKSRPQPGNQPNPNQPNNQENYNRRKQRGKNWRKKKIQRHREHSVLHKQKILLSAVTYAMASAVLKHTAMEEATRGAVVEAGEGRRIE